MASPPKSSAGMRPKRFALELPVEVRPYDSDRWWGAKTQDISANGVLFRSRKHMRPQTPVDMKLELPTALTGDATVRLLCSGFVVRSTEPRSPSDEAQIAATFIDFRFSNGKAGPMAELRQAQQFGYARRRR